MKSLARYLMAVSIALIAMQAHATLMLTPGDAIDSGLQNNTPDILQYLEANYPLLGDELYKAEVGGGEEGSLAGSYETTFLNTASDPSGALIEFVSGPYFDCPTCYLLVKDGKHDPAWYLFNLGSWNGMESISLSGFWPQQGAISHIGIFGSPSENVPEPGIMGLLAIGLMAIGSRKFIRIN